MRMKWLLALLLLAASPAWAQSHSGGGMNPQASNATLPDAVNNLGLGAAATVQFTRLGLDGQAPGFTDSWLRIGTLSSLSPTPDPVFVFGRTINTTSNAHGITDASVFNGTGSGSSYNSYDSRPQIEATGSTGGSHFVSFQARPDVVGTASVPNLRGFHYQPQLWDSAYADEIDGFYGLNPNFNGTSSYRIYKMFYAEKVSTAACCGGGAWSFYDNGNLNYFGGFVGFGYNTPTAPIEFGGARGDEVTVKDIHSVYTRTTNGSAWLFTPLTNFPATGTQQFWTIRPAFAPLANSSSIIYGVNFAPQLGSGSANAFNVTGELTALRTGWTTDSLYTGAVTKLFGEHIVDATAGGATITGQAGLVIDNLATGTNRTLLLLGSTTVPSGVFSIYSPSSKNWFSAAQMLLGDSSTALTIGGVSTQALQVVGASGTGYAKTTVARFDASAAGAAAFYAKSRGSVATAGAVQSGDTLMQLTALGDDGSTNGQITVQGASISAVVDGSVSSGIVPTKITWTTMNAAGASAERMELTSAGLLAMGTGGASTPALKPSGSIMQMRLRDDSAYAPLEANTIRTATAYTVGTLPAAGSAGRRAYVTDQNAACPAVGAALTGGGAVVCPVFDNGSAWVGG